MTDIQPTLHDVLSQLDPDKMDEVLIESVEQYSPSYAEEPAMEVFASRLAEAGISYMRQPVPGQGAPGTDHRANLIVEVGPEPPSMMWVGHVDTVPLIDDEEQVVQRDGDILHGLGTADMKSGCTAIIEALIALVKSGAKFQRGLCIGLVVGEEEYGDGSEALLDQYNAPLVVIGEPTGLKACVSHYGYYECLLKSRGTRAHAALPEVGASAIHAMLVWMQQILEAGRDVPFAEKLMVNPREIRGGAELFAVAEQCEAAVDIHVPPTVGKQAIEEFIEHARVATLETHQGCELAFENVFWASGYANATDHPLLNSLHKAYDVIEAPWKPTAFRSHSDGSLFHEKGSIPVICGPGRLEVAHTRGECVSLKEVHDAARLYTAMIYETCVR